MPSDRMKFESHYQQSCNLLNTKNLEGALLEIDAALDLNRGSGKAYFQKGLILMEMKRYGEAARAFADAIGQDTDENAKKYMPYKEKSEALSIENEGYPLRYIEGHSAFLQSSGIHLKLGVDLFEIPEFNIQVPYEKVTQIKISSMEDVSALREKSMMSNEFEQPKLVLAFVDRIGLQQTMLFDSGDINNIEQLVFKKVEEARSKIAASGLIGDGREIVSETRVIVKIRCSYCRSLYDETLDKCPYCGGHT
jgi:tetratricopeptide (TPR) repeat protein